MIGSVVVLYNPTKSEISNINTYLDKVDFEVVIDNSAVNNRELIYSLLNENKKVIYYSEQKNLGLCKGFNIGINILKTKGCEWALLFDADSKLGNDIISIYNDAINIYKNKSIALFAPVHLFDRGNKKTYNGYKNIEWSMTSGWLVNIDIFIKQNGFFESLFVDGLDMDYCLKCHENGYRIVECGSAIINHNPATTKKIMGFKYGIAVPYRYYMQTRQLIWCWRRYKYNKAFIIYLYKWIKVICLFPDKRLYFKEMIKGSKEGIELWKEWMK